MAFLFKQSNVEEVFTKINCIFLDYIILWWQEYRLSTRLPGSAGPINCLAFTEGGKFLASGGKCRYLRKEHHWRCVGDDEKLHIWDIDGKRPYQIISDELERWGQITCMKWLPGISNNGEVICFGTGRGLVLIYHRLKEAVSIYNKIEERNKLTVKQNKFKELSNTIVLPFNEPVESMDYDASKSRLALSSHTGKIKIFRLEKDGMNYLPWVSWDRWLKTFRDVGIFMEQKLEWYTGK